MSGPAQPAGVVTPHTGGPEVVYLVPHTHWDREWYEPFQRFRLRLVDLLDDVIARAEADPTFHFTLDGQLAAVDDYLEVRPEAAPRIAALVHTGQFAIGPWAILMDEFLCSGESIVRNLEWGLRRAGELGGAMPVGYLPDMFGHCAQMPQILAGAGLRQACVWRGVPAAVDRHAFVWQAPDGTAIRTEYLPGGYGNAAELVEDPDRLARAAAGHVAAARPWFGADPILAMYGTDHSAPLPWLSAAVAGVDGGIRLRLCTLAQYLERFDGTAVDGLPVWRGELRSHARANILPGVLSNRPHLKRDLSGAERMVERYAEPLAALWTPPERWPARLLELAWQRLVQCSCHDSVTGCGVDETAVQVAARIAEAEQIGRGVRDRALEAMAALAPADASVVVNPSPHQRCDIVTLALPLPPLPPLPLLPPAVPAVPAAPAVPAVPALPAAPDRPAVAACLPDGSRLAVQPVASNTGQALYSTVRPAARVAAGLRKGSLGLDFLGRRVQQVEVTGDRELTVTVGRVGPGLTASHRALAGEVARAAGDWRLRVVEEPLCTAYVAVPAPALGATCVRPVPAAEPVPVPGAVTTGEQRLANDRLTVTVAADGTLDMSTVEGVRLSGVARLVDGGDAGDLYNYAPPPDDRLVDTPSAVTVTVLERGPLVGALRVRRVYPWAEVDTRVELRAAEPFCRLEVAFVNRHADHRVRLHVPLAERAGTSYAEGQFAVVARGLTSEGGHGEEPLPTFPAYSFVDAGGVAVLLDQASEYELTAGGTELALTLLRATGVISRAEHPLRAEPAGPVLATPAAQCLGEVRTRLAVLPHPGGWAEAGVTAAAEAFRCPFVAVGGTGPLDAPFAERPGLAVSGDGVVLTSLRRRDRDWWELRLVAMTDAPTTATVAGPAVVHGVEPAVGGPAEATGPLIAARRADLLGVPGVALPVERGAVRLALRPWEIATLQVQPARPQGVSTG
ncbi:MAG TPA: glycoside hydrolase family 38 C-terminal domain-containing protein [Micromonosporaceae bacterium]|nr:glycoside hydrolase family 38 C-terminal domain-containing protein [Micromonosporaceae bacterium]